MTKKAGSFNAYLEYAERAKKAPTKPATGPLDVLKTLSTIPNSELPLDLLLKLSGMDAPVFRDTLKELRDKQFIEVSGATLEEIVKLTPKGAEVVQLTSSL
jgi:predicted transcriptional regulator